MIENVIGQYTLPLAVWTQIINWEDKLSFDSYFV
jgi:hypothetical protein